MNMKEFKKSLEKIAPNPEFASAELREDNLITLDGDFSLSQVIELGKLANIFKTAISLKEFKINLNPEKPKKCIHCKKTLGMHQAGTSHCPSGPYTRIGQVGFDKKKVFTPKEK